MQPPCKARRYRIPADPGPGGYTGRDRIACVLILSDFKSELQVIKIAMEFEEVKPEHLSLLGRESK